MQNRTSDIKETKTRKTQRPQKVSHRTLAKFIKFRPPFGNEGVDESFTKSVTSVWNTWPYDQCMINKKYFCPFIDTKLSFGEYNFFIFHHLKEFTMSIIFIKRIFKQRISATSNPCLRIKFTVNAKKNNLSWNNFICSCLVSSRILRRFRELLGARPLSELRWEARRRGSFPCLCAHTEEHLVPLRKFLNQGILLLFAVSLWHRQSRCSTLQRVSCRCHKKSNNKFRCFRSSP